MSISLGQRVKHWIKDAYSVRTLCSDCYGCPEGSLLYASPAKPNPPLRTVDAFRNGFVTCQELEFSTRFSAVCISVRAWTSRLSSDLSLACISARARTSRLSSDLSLVCISARAWTSLLSSDLSLACISARA